MSKRPRVSVIMPVHNGQQFIADALHSIRRQGIDSLEIVVVDDGSTDRTREVLESEFPECNYLFQERAGPASARNAGLAAARGELIGFLDADDLFAGGGLAALDAALAATESADIAMGSVRVTQRTAGSNSSSFEPNGQAVVSYNLGSMLARRAVFDEVGLFDTRYLHCEDVDWFLRAQEHGVSFEMLSEVVLLYRRHDANMSRDVTATGVCLAKVLKASLDRRRQLPERGAKSLDEFYYVRPARMRV